MLFHFAKIHRHHATFSKALHNLMSRTMVIQRHKFNGSPETDYWIVLSVNVITIQDDGIIKGDSQLIRTCAP